jgi:hypothetical protein
MQCNVCTEVRPSKRNEVSRLFFFISFIFFKNTKKWQNLVEASFKPGPLFKMQQCTDGRWSQVSNSGPLAKWKSECTDGRTYEVILPLAKMEISIKMSVCTNVTDGQTSFSYFSLVSVQSSKSVRPYGGPEPKKNDGQTHRQTTQIRSEVIQLNVTDGTIQEQTCRTINITFSQYAM